MKRVLSLTLLLFALCAAPAGAKCHTSSDNAIPDVWKSVLKTQPTSEVRIHAEGTTADSRLSLVLYSRHMQPNSRDWSLHIAAIEARSKKPVLLDEKDITRFLPGGLPDVERRPLSTCLNSFVISGGLQAVHVPLRIESVGKDGEISASDLVLVVLEDDSFQPVLHLANTTRSEPWNATVITKDSDLLTFSRDNQVDELLWVRSSRGATKILEAGMTETILYSWGGRGFRKIGTISDQELETRRKTGQTLPRGESAISKSKASGIAVSTD